jgi:hypothetical protein
VEKPVSSALASIKEPWQARGFGNFTKGWNTKCNSADQRMLDTLECEGASFLWLARGYLGMNSTRSSTDNMGEGTSNAMFFRTRPRDDAF